MRGRFPLLLVLVLALGCGGVKRASVSGTVTLDGQPLPNALVSFQPVGEGQVTPGPGSTGRTDDKGKYTLQVSGGGKGAVVGWHKVRISCPVPEGPGNPDEDRPAPRKDRVPDRYNRKSELKFEVKPGSNTADWPLTTE
jgi:hypothetical protein